MVLIYINDVRDTMIKSVNQLVNEVCNSRCNMCSIWMLRKNPNEMTPNDFGRLYSRKEFSGVVDLCISGGEPTMRRDLPEIMDNIFSAIPNQLKMLFLSTNCSFPERVLTFMKTNSKRVENIYTCASLEGNRETHKAIRGVDSYDLVVETLKAVRDLKLPNVHNIISSTMQSRNANAESLEHIKLIATETASTFSFRPVMISDTFYRNAQTTASDLTPEQLSFIMDYIKKEKMNDPFMVILKDFMEGKATIMGDRNSGIKCLAGDISVFIKSDGLMHPCINSTRIIGDKEHGLYNVTYKLGDMEGCPCCTECQIYPMINFSDYATRGVGK
jgi:MoaA/NifB/PqqE/SkfB family radical SAM enzyme